MHCLPFIKKENKIFSRRIEVNNKMNINEFKMDICRICLEDNVWLDWNTFLQYYDMTYKDCYYKYTQLEYTDTDPFPQMLCHNCCNALISVHTLILKALESQKYLQDKYSLHMKFEKDNLNLNSTTGHNRFGDTKYTSTEFETVLIEKIEFEPVIDDNFVYDDPDEVVSLALKVPKKPFKQIRKKSAIGEKPARTKPRSAKSKTEVKTHDSLKEPPNHLIKMSTSKSKCTIGIKKSKPAAIVVNDVKSIIVEGQNSEKQTQEECNYIETDSKDDIKTEEEGELTNVEPKVKMSYNKKKIPRMCSICSKIVYSTFALNMHEKTHLENRERKETCTICGLKFFHKRHLDWHMQIHEENREKRHKCEFCSKAFYDKGGLNIHRRLHLGQMIPCTLCSKQFFRQLDLDRHTTSAHSATTINTDTKKRSRYFVRCKHCGKSILSTSFKSHTAAHLNEPLMKCTVCSKEYFTRKSCVAHVKKVHQKTNEEYNDFILIYKKNRISHLFLEQNADIQSNIE